MRYWLLAVCLLMLSISVAAESDALTLDPITPDNVGHIEILRQFGTIPEPFCDCGDGLFHIEDDKLYYKTGPDQFMELPTPSGAWSWPFINARSGPYLAGVAAISGSEAHYIVMVWDIEAETPTLLLTTPPIEETPSLNWRPDSGAIAIDSTVYRIPEGEAAFQHVRLLRSGTDVDWCDGRTETSKGDSSISWSPDSTRYAALASNFCASSVANYGIFDAETGALIHELENSTVDLNWSPLIWSPQSTKVTNGYNIWSADTGAHMAYLESDNKYYGLEPSSVRWLDDDYLFGSQPSFVITDTTTFHKWEASSGLATFAYEVPRPRDVNIEGSTLSFTSTFAHVTVDMETKVVQTAPLPQPLGGSLAWSPDGSRLLVVTGSAPSPLIQVWGADALLNDPEPHPQWQQNADWLAYQEQSKTYEALWTKPVWLNEDEFFTYSGIEVRLPSWMRIRRWNQATQQTADVYWLSSSKSALFPNPDLTLLAEVTSEPTIRILDAVTHEEVTRLTGVTLPSIPAIRWSPTGDQLAVFDPVGGHEVTVWDLAQPDMPNIVHAPEREPEIHMERDAIDEVAWHPNGTTLALVRFWSVDMIDLADNRVINTFTIDDDADIVSAAWNSDATLLMLVTQSRRGLIFLDGLGENILAEFPDLRWGSAHWSPDGRLVAYSDGNNLLLLGIPEQSQ